MTFWSKDAFLMTESLEIDTAKLLLMFMKSIENKCVPSGREMVAGDIL
jgi:hypothetical protein